MSGQIEQHRLPYTWVGACTYYLNNQKSVLLKQYPQAILTLKIKLACTMMHSCRVVTIPPRHAASGNWYQNFHDNATPDARPSIDAAVGNSGKNIGEDCLA